MTFIISLVLSLNYMSLEEFRKSFNIDQWRIFKIISDLYVLSNAVPYGLNDVNVCTSALIQNLYSIIESHAPTKRRTIRHNGVPFMNSQLRKLQHERNRARNIKTKFPTAENHEKYRTLRNKIIIAKQIFQRAMRRWTKKSKFLAHY